MVLIVLLSQCRTSPDSSSSIFTRLHNLGYWIGRDYIGIGRTAHGRIRFNDKLYAVNNPLQLEELTPQEKAEELIIMGLRLTSGINKETFQKICNLSFDNFINKKFKDNAIAQGLIEETNNCLRATKKGFLLIDYLIVGLCS